MTYYQVQRYYPRFKQWDIVADRDGDPYEFDFESDARTWAEVIFPEGTMYRVVMKRLTTDILESAITPIY